jgi:hypothetical protein
MGWPMEDEWNINNNNNETDESIVEQQLPWLIHCSSSNKMVEFMEFNGLSMDLDTWNIMK